MAKLTIVEKYENIIEKAKGVLTDAELDFLRERAEMHAKKNGSRKPTKVQVANEQLKVDILNFMEVDKAYTISEIQKGLGIETNQKASALVRQLKEKDLVVRTESKGKAYFTKA